MNQKLITLVVAIFLVCTLAVTPTSAKVVFADVATTDAAYDEIQYLISLGAINGYQEVNGKTNFKPNNSVTRGHAAKMAVIAAGKSPLKVSKSSYTDVKVGTELSTYIERARELGLFTKTSGQFNPNEPLSREEMSHVLAKAFNLNVSDYQNLAMYFQDVSTTNTYAPYIKAIYYNGITIGSGNGKYMPKSTVTRAQFASFIARAKSDEFRLALPERNTSGNTGKIVFADVGANYAAYEEIQYLISLGAINGYQENGKTYYKPNNSVTRGHAAKMAVISAGKGPLKVSQSSYTDVKVGTELSLYIERARELGLFTKTSGQFNPNEPLSREEMSHVLAKAFNLNGSDYKDLAMYFQDVPGTNTYAPYIKAIYYNGITIGSGNGKYMPKSTVTRAQFASFIARAKSNQFRLPLPEKLEAVDTSQVIGLISVTTDGLNVRTKPTTSGTVMGRVDTGGKLSVYAVEGNWLKVSYQGAYGYISKSYAKFLEQNGNSIGQSTKSVTANATLNLYYKPTSSSKKITQISTGTTLSVYKEISGYYLTMVDGIPGYIVKNSTTVVPGSVVEPPKTDTENDNSNPVTTSTTGKVTVSSLNMRQSASDSSPKIKSLSKGTVVAVHSISGFWAKVTSGSDTGYVHKSYLKLMNGTGSAVKGRIIILDPGHGGKDPGAVNSGHTEKAIVLKVGNLVKQKLEANGAKVYTTRAGDTFPTLQERVNFTKSKYGEVFVSIHVNAATSTSAKGTETYYSISTGDQFEEDKKLATYINNEIVTNANMKNRGVKEAQYYVTRNMIIPSVLVELGFISNAEDRKKLINDKYVEIYAQSIYNGIVDYYKK